MLVKDPYETKYLFLINRKIYFKDPNTSTEHSKNIKNIYKKYWWAESKENCKILIVFDNLIVATLISQKVKAQVTELITCRRKLNICLSDY